MAAMAEVELQHVTGILLIPASSFECICILWYVFVFLCLYLEPGHQASRSCTKAVCGSQQLTVKLSLGWAGSLVQVPGFHEACISFVQLSFQDFQAPRHHDSRMCWMMCYDHYAGVHRGCGSGGAADDS